MEDRRAHERIDSLESVFGRHLQEHEKLEIAIAENTRLIQDIADNTGELVTLMKGAKVGGKFIVWIAPIVAAFVTGWAWLKDHLK